jgi:hypothetical protein
MKKIIAVTFLALTANAFAGGDFPTGSYENGKDTLSITAVGDYEVTKAGTTSSGFHLAGDTCVSAGGAGNLKVVDTHGNTMCYNSSVHGNRLVIEKLSNSLLSGIWIKQ